MLLQRYVCKWCWITKKTKKHFECKATNDFLFYVSVKFYIIWVLAKKKIMHDIVFRLNNAWQYKQYWAERQGDFVSWLRMYCVEGTSICELTTLTVLFTKRRVLFNSSFFFFLFLSKTRYRYKVANVWFFLVDNSDVASEWQSLVFFFCMFRY